MDLDKENQLVDMIDFGGKTGYYALPSPKLSDIIRLLHVWDGKDFVNLATAIRALFPQTLNDIIEHQDMSPWQHEVMKACYAIKARAAKNGGSELRELNKMTYYIERRRQQLLKEGKK